MSQLVDTQRPSVATVVIGGPPGTLPALGKHACQPPSPPVPWSRQGFTGTLQHQLKVLSVSYLPPLFPFRSILSSTLAGWTTGVNPIPWWRPKRWLPLSITCLPLGPTWTCEYPGPGEGAPDSGSQWSTCVLLFPCRYMFIGGTNFAYWNGKIRFTSVGKNLSFFPVCDLGDGVSVANFYFLFPFAF